MRSFATRLLTAGLVFAVALTTACDSASEPKALATIVVTPNISLGINATQQFVAVGKDVDGGIVVITPVWSVVSGSGAISTTGLYTAGTVLGSVSVKATSGTISGTAVVTVIAGPLATIAIAPSSPSLAVNATQQFTATGADVAGNPVTFTAAWSVAAGGGAVSSTGLFTAGTTAGTFTNTLTATSGSISKTATITVTAGALATIAVSPGSATLASGATQLFVAVGRDASNNVVAISPAWSVAASGGSIASSGLFTAGTTAGTFSNTVTATSGNISGTATVTVSAGALATIAVTPSPASVAINATQQFAAEGRDANNNVVAITPVWSIAAGGGTISASGLFTAGAAIGTYTNTVVATSGAVSAASTVVVTTGSVATITVSPSSATLAQGGTQQYTAVGRDAANNVVTITPVWSVEAGGGTISASGLFTAGTTPGTFTNTVKATSGAISGTATVTVSAPALLAPVLLGAAGNYVILAKSGISNVPTSAITGDLGLSPAAASFITGFSLSLAAGDNFSTSPQVTGKVYAADYDVPTPSNLTTAVSDMETAYTDAAGRPTPDFVELATGAIGGLTLTPGLYKWSNTVTISSNVTLNGSATDVWIFQIAGGITQASATQVFLTGGALAKNVFWQVFGVVEIGTTAHMEGIILSQTSITLATGASANGRLLAQTAVSLEGNTVVKPAP
jgi:hypothetical protein